MTRVAEAHITVGIAFLAGLVSFVSPCVLPLVPAYLSFLTGSSVDELRAGTALNARANATVHALAFIIGFTLVFVALGASASAIGGVLLANRILIARIGGIIVIVLGLQMLGILRLRFLAMDTRLQVRSEKRSLVTSGIVGVAFAAGWSPCIGPILAAILALASQANGVWQGAWLLFVYSMGLAVPFIVTALAIGTVLPALNRIKRFLPAVEMAAGVFMILTGVVLVNNWFLRVAGFFYSFVPQPKL
ncbi:MAG TPA: cytochrome c biogenesis protein CcdA [Candidatus Baltobacteraceae bacterium]|nr:cytochrome c biogenesis protein CcdA [Candidatus Baltobacteraceae bacterium]